MIAPSSTVRVVIGHALGAELDGVVSPLVVVNDNFLLGPSSTNARRHRAFRARYWKAPQLPDLEHEIGPEGPLCVYLPPTPSGFLTLCQLCFIATRQNREILVVDLSAKLSARSTGIDPTPETVFDATAILEQRPPAARWSALQTAFAATVWTLWCRRSPTAFSRFCAAGSALHPLLADLARYHAGRFPRLTSKGLMLARFDELLLQQLSGEWSTPAQLYVKAMKAGAELEAWISHTGDLYIARRLLAWFRHTEGRIVERRREHPANPSDLTRWSYRWHPGAETLLESLPSLDAAPPVKIGGAVAYDPERPWFCRVDASGPHVRPFARPRGS